jgi:transposase
MSGVVIGMDPHKRSATIEVIDDRSRSSRRDATARTPSATKRCSWPAAGSPTGSGRSRRVAESAHRAAPVRRRRDRARRASEAVRPGAGVRHRAGPQDRPGRRAQRRGGRATKPRPTAGWPPTTPTVVLRLLVDRRDELARAHTETVSRIHHLLLELIPSGAKKFLTRGQASRLLRTAPPPVGVLARTATISPVSSSTSSPPSNAKIRAADKQLRQLVTAHGSSLTDLYGIGPSEAARLIGDISRVRTAAHLASCNGTAPLEDRRRRPGRVSTRVRRGWLGEWAR